jgi:hypothetical protein
MSEPNDTTQIVRYARFAQKDSVKKKEEGGWINRIMRWSNANYIIIILELTWRCHCGNSEENDIHLLLGSQCDFQEKDVRVSD